MSQFANKLSAHAALLLSNREHQEVLMMTLQDLKADDEDSVYRLGYIEIRATENTGSYRRYEITNADGHMLCDVFESEKKAVELLSLFHIAELAAEITLKKKHVKIIEQIRQLHGYPEALFVLSSLDAAALLDGRQAA